MKVIFLTTFLAVCSLASGAKCKGTLPKKFDYTSQHTGKQELRVTEYGKQQETKKVTFVFAPGTKYHFSWNANHDRYSWHDARKYCRSLCMDMVSFEDGQTWIQAAQWFQGERGTYVAAASFLGINIYITINLIKKTLYFLIAAAPEFFWTSGRKCNFKGCNAPRYQPVNVNGWFWALVDSKKKKIIVDKAVRKEKRGSIFRKTPIIMKFKNLFRSSKSLLGLAGPIAV